MKTYIAKSGMALVFTLAVSACSEPKLTPYDMKRAKEFLLSSLPPLTPDPTNRVADDQDAATLGAMLFTDTAMSANGEVSCASCHQFENQFQDGLPQGEAIGTTARRTMPLAGVQWGSWFFWDGRKDSQWSQALEPLETPEEHGMTRAQIARHVLTRYRETYETLFGSAPDIADWPVLASPLVEGEAQTNWLETPKETQVEINTVFANAGKALAAFQRTILPQENRVDRFFEARLKGEPLSEDDQLSEDEIEGFKLFTGKARCDNCHSGPLYSDGFFHNTGVPIADPETPDYGRAGVLSIIKADPFSCLGRYSDAPSDACRELRFMSMDAETLKGAFKTPGLRGVASRAPYMHAGQIETLEDVIQHYVEGADPFGDMEEIDGTTKPHGVHIDVPQIELTDREKQQLLAFLKAL